MKQHIVLAGPQLSPLAAVSGQMSAGEYSVTLLQSPEPLARLTAETAQMAGAVVFLTGSEGVMDFRALFEARPECAFVFLLAEFPPHAAIRRLVGQHAAAILRSTESPLVVLATLTSLLTQMELAHCHG